MRILRLSMWLVLALLLPALSVDAGGKKKTVAPTTAQLVAELHNTRVLLQNADHDYNGYRAKAVHELGKAMHELDPHHKHKLPPGINGTNGEAQTKSDAQLAKAGTQIQTIMNQLASLNVATPATTKAMQHMQNAKVHLTTALQIK